MTTVGYGDFYPTSAEGKLIGAVTTIIGILVLALPITIIGTNFADEYAAEKNKQAARVAARVQSQSPGKQDRSLGNSIHPEVESSDSLDTSGEASNAVIVTSHQKIKVLSTELCDNIKAQPPKRQQAFILQEIDYITRQALDSQLTPSELDAFAVAVFNCITNSLSVRNEKAVRKALIKFLDICNDEIKPRFHN